MQVSLKPSDIAPQLLHVLILDLKELKPINIKANNRRGIKNKSCLLYTSDAADEL